MYLCIRKKYFEKYRYNYIYLNTVILIYNKYLELFFFIYSNWNKCIPTRTDFTKHNLIDIDA